jgi:hypothetical protein
MFILASRRTRLLGGSFLPKAAKRNRRGPELQQLRGWQQVCAFLGQPISIVRRWAKEGMPVKKKGRFVTAATEELDRWLEQEARG